MKVIVNGETMEFEQPISVQDMLASLSVDTQGLAIAQARGASLITGVLRQCCDGLVCQGFELGISTARSTPGTCVSPPCILPQFCGLQPPARKLGGVEDSVGCCEGYTCGEGGTCEPESQFCQIDMK